MSGLAPSAPPDGLMRVSPFSPSASRTISSSGLNCAWSSATSKPPCSAPASSPARRVDALSVRSRTPMCGASIRWSMPRIHAGRSQCARATSSAAITIAHAPSVTGKMSASRSGAWVTGRAEQRVGVDVLLADRVRVAERVARRPRRDLGEVALAGLDRRRAARSPAAPAKLISDGHSGVTVYGSLCSVNTWCTSVSDDFPKP